MNKVEKTIQSIIEKSGLLGVLSLALMTLLTFCDVFLRYFFKRPIVGSTEITEFIMVCVVFFSLAWCSLRGDHVAVDLITSKLSGRGLRISDSINYILTALVGLLIATQSFEQAEYLKDIALKSQLLNIPRYPFLVISTFGFVLLFLDATLHLYNTNIKSFVKTKHDKKEIKTNI